MLSEALIVQARTPITLILQKLKFNHYNATATYPNRSLTLILSRDVCLLCLMPCLLARLLACVLACLHTCMHVCISLNRYAFPCVC